LLIVEAPPPSSPLVTVMCWIEDDRSSFPIKFDPNEVIGDLKEAILAEKPNLSITDASTLQLFKANIPDTDTDREQFSFNDRKVLPGSQKLSSVFVGDPPKDEHIHIAIKRPGKWIQHPCHYTSPPKEDRS
jgi:hypothetical protein